MGKKFNGQRNSHRRVEIEDSNKWREVKFKAYVKSSVTYAVQINEPFEVDTLEGLMRGQAGDYLAVGVQGEMYPIARDIFETVYVEVE